MQTLKVQSNFQITSSKILAPLPRAHLGTTTGSRLCPKDQPQQVRMPRVAELSENAWPRRAAAAGAPHTAAVRSRAFGGGIKMGPPAGCAKETTWQRNGSSVSKVPSLPMRLGIFVIAVL